MLTPLRVDYLKHMIKHIRHDASITDRLQAAYHCVSLSSACLAICEHSSVVASETTFHN